MLGKFLKGMAVKVKDYKRYRSIYVNSELVNPVEKNKKGYTGIVDDVYGDAGTVVVKRFVERRWGGEWSYEEYSPDELEIIDSSGNDQ